MAEKYIKIHKKGSDERKLLERCAEVLTKTDCRGRKYHVDETYFDFGKDWMWTTILATDSVMGDYQALRPIDQQDILCGADPTEIAIRVLADKYVPTTRNAERQYTATCVTADGKQMSIEGTIQQCSNWADNVIRASGACSITVERKGD